MNLLNKCDMFGARTVVFFVLLSFACGCEGRKLYEDSQNDEDDSMDCNDGRKIDDPILLPFLQKLRGREMLPERMKEWVIYFDGSDVKEMFDGWNASYLTESGLSNEDQGTPYGRIYFTDNVNVYLPNLKPFQDDWTEFRVMYAEQLLLDAIGKVKIYINRDSQTEKISKSSARLLQILLKRSNPETVAVISSSCEESCPQHSDNPLISLASCGSAYGKNYLIECERPVDSFRESFFNKTEASHFEKSLTPQFQVQLPAQLNQELQNILDWLLKRIGQRMKNYMEMAFRKNRFRKTPTELYNKVNLQINKIRGGKTFEAAKSADLIYNSLFDLNVYLNVTNTPYTFDKFHTFNLYLGYIGQFSKWQLDTTKYANFFEPLRELCLSQISIGNNLLKPAEKIFELEEGVYDLNGVICHENVLFVINGMTTINTIKSGLFDNEHCDFDTVFVLAKKNITINENLKIPGKNLVIFAPTWIIFTEHVFDLSGTNGTSDGRVESGQNGGDFFGFGLKFEKSGLLKVVANGGDGSAGRDATAVVADDRFTDEEGGRCVIKKGKEKEILAEHGATYGGPGGSAGTATMKILRNPVQNLTVVRVDGKEGRKGNAHDIILQCKNNQEVTLQADEPTEINFPANDIQRMNESSVLELFRKIIRKNSRRLSYDVLNFYKEVWTSPLTGRTLDSTLNDYLNSSDYTADSKDFYEITSQILHTQIKQTCDMTETQKILLDFALATIRMTAPAENVLPSVIDINSYLKEVSNSVGKTDIEDEYFENKEKKFRKIIEEANYYLKASLLPSLRRSMAETHGYLKENADEYLVHGNLSEGRKFQESLVVNNLLRYLTEILEHVQISLEDFVTAEQFNSSVTPPAEEFDTEKLEKKLYFFRYLRNNITVKEMNAMSEFIKLLRVVVEEDVLASKCSSCKQQLTHSIQTLRNILRESPDKCKDCKEIVKKRENPRSKRFAESDEPCIRCNGDCFLCGWCDSCQMQCGTCTSCVRCPWCPRCKQENNGCRKCRKCSNCPECPQCRQEPVSLPIIECSSCKACSVCPECPQCQPLCQKNVDCILNSHCPQCRDDEFCDSCNNCNVCPNCEKCNPQNECSSCNDCGKCPTCAKCSKRHFDEIDAGLFWNRNNLDMMRMLAEELKSPQVDESIGNICPECSKRHFDEIDAGLFWNRNNPEVMRMLAEKLNPPQVDEGMGIICAECDQRHFDEIDAGLFWKRNSPEVIRMLAEKLNSPQVDESIGNICLECSKRHFDEIDAGLFWKRNNLDLMQMLVNKLRAPQVDESTVNMCAECPSCPECSERHFDQIVAGLFLKRYSPEMMKTLSEQLNIPEVDQSMANICTECDKRHFDEIDAGLFWNRNNPATMGMFAEKLKPPQADESMTNICAECEKRHFDEIDAGLFWKRNNPDIMRMLAEQLNIPEVDQSTGNICGECPTCPECSKRHFDEIDAGLFWKKINLGMMRVLAEQLNIPEEDESIGNICAECPTCPECSSRHFDEIDAGLFWKRNSPEMMRVLAEKLKSPQVDESIGNICPECSKRHFDEIDAGLFWKRNSPEIMRMLAEQLKPSQVDQNMANICAECDKRLFEEIYAGLFWKRINLGMMRVLAEQLNIPEEDESIGNICAECPTCPECSSRHFDEIDAGLFWKRNSPEIMRMLAEKLNPSLVEESIGNICPECSKRHFDEIDAGLFWKRNSPEIMRMLAEQLNIPEVDQSIGNICAECPTCPECNSRHFDEIDAGLFWKRNSPEIMRMLAEKLNPSLVEESIGNICPECSKRHFDEIDAGLFWKRINLGMMRILAEQLNIPEEDESIGNICAECPTCPECSSRHFDEIDAGLFWNRNNPATMGMFAEKLTPPQVDEGMGIICAECDQRHFDEIDAGLFWKRNSPEIMRMLAEQLDVPDADDSISNICAECPSCPECSKRHFDEIDAGLFWNRNNLQDILGVPFENEENLSNMQRKVRADLYNLNDRRKRTMLKQSSLYGNKKRSHSSEELEMLPCSDNNGEECSESESVCRDCLSNLMKLKGDVDRFVAGGEVECDAGAMTFCQNALDTLSKITPEVRNSTWNRDGPGNGSTIRLKCGDCNDTLDFFSEKLHAEISRCELENNYNYRQVESKCSSSGGIVFHMTGCDPETFSRTYDEIRENFLREFSQFVAADEEHSNELDHIQNNFAYLLTNIDMILQEGLSLSGASLNNLLYVTDALIKFKDLKMEYQKRMTELHDFSETDMYDLFSAEISMQNERLDMTSKWLNQLKKLMPWTRKVMQFLGANPKFQEVNERIREAMRLVSEIGHNVKLVERHRELRNYIRRVRVIEKKEKTTGVGQAILDLKNIFQKTFVKDVFHKAVVTAQNWVFPLAKSYLAIQKIQNKTYQSHLKAVSAEIEEYRKSIMLYTTVHAFDSTKNEIPFYEWRVRTRPTLLRDLFSGKPVILVSEILDGGKKNSLMAKDFEVKFVAGQRQPPGTQELIDDALKGFWLNLTHSGISYFKFGSRIYRRLTETFTFRHTANSGGREKVKSAIDYVLSPYTTWVLRLEPDSRGNYPLQLQDKIGSIELVGTGRYVINCADIPDVNQYFVPLNDYSRRNEK